VVYFILSEHTCSSVVPIVNIIMSNFEYAKYSSLLNTLKGNCFDDEQYVYCTKSRGTKARSWSWSCHSGLDVGLGLVSFGLGLVVLVLVFVLVLRIWSCSHYWLTMAKPGVLKWGVWGRSPQRGPGRAPGQGVRGRAPLKLKAF